MPSRLEASEMLPPQASSVDWMSAISDSPSVCGEGAGAGALADADADADAGNDDEADGDASPAAVAPCAGGGADADRAAAAARASSRKSSDRCSSVISGSSAAITAAVRSTLASWRMLPG